MNGKVVSVSENASFLKVLYVGFKLVLQSKYKILERFFSPGPSSSDLEHTQAVRLTTPTGTRAHDDDSNEISNKKLSMLTWAVS